MVLRTVLLCACVAAPGAASAITLSLDPGAAWVTSSKVHNRTGYGVALRLGSDLDVPGAKAALEIGGAITAFSADRPADIGNLNQIFAGARLGTGEFVRPGLFAHLGYGWTGGAGNGFNNGLYLEGGVFVDLALPVVSVGIHGSYQSFLTGSFLESDAFTAGSEHPSVLTAGVHASMSF